MANGKDQVDQNAYYDPVEAVSALELILMPTAVSWQVPAFLGYSGYNASISAAEHVCIMRRWHDFYGAELVALSYNFIETNLHLKIFFAEKFSSS